MNEQIKELKKLATTTRYTGHGEIDELDVEKFALLIAKECAVLAMTEHHSTSPAEYDEMEPYEQGCDDTASAISGKIRRIFGS